MLSNPIMAGLCSYEDLMRMDLNQVADMNEILVVRVVNERRAHEAAKRNAEQRG